MVGFRRIPTSDPEEQRLRDAWYAAETTAAKHEAHEALSTYIWNRVEAVVAEDRKRHPKKLRNLPVPKTGPSGGRYLP